MAFFFLEIHFGYSNDVINFFKNFQIIYENA